MKHTFYLHALLYKTFPNYTGITCINLRTQCQQIRLIPKKVIQLHFFKVNADDAICNKWFCIKLKRVFKPYVILCSSASFLQKTLEHREAVTNKTTPSNHPSMRTADLPTCQQRKVFRWKRLYHNLSQEILNYTLDQVNEGVKLRRTYCADKETFLPNGLRFTSKIMC